MAETAEKFTRQVSHQISRGIGALVVAAFVVTGSSVAGFAGSDGSYFSGSSTKIYSKRKASRYYPTAKSSSRRTSKPYFAGSKYDRPRYKGPQVLDVKKSILRKRNRIIIITPPKISPGVKRQEIDAGASGTRTVYYDESKCGNGLECTIYLGNTPSSPKIIVLGKKQKIEESGPLVIYPPS